MGLLGFSQLLLISYTELNLILLGMHYLLIIVLFKTDYWPVNYTGPQRYITTLGT